MPEQPIDLRKLKEEIERIPDDKRGDKLNKLLKCMKDFCDERTAPGGDKRGMFETFRW